MRDDRHGPRGPRRLAEEQLLRHGGTGGGNCVEVAPLADGRIALRDSNHPEAGTVFFTRPEMHAWIKGCMAGEFDDLS